MTLLVHLFFSIFEKPHLIDKRPEDISKVFCTTIVARSLHTCRLWGLRFGPKGPMSRMLECVCLPTPDPYVTIGP
jgi:hypothetical protein